MNFIARILMNRALWKCKSAVLRILMNLSYVNVVIFGSWRHRYRMAAGRRSPWPQAKDLETILLNYYCYLENLYQT